jgi:pimeloyl-ACP methyl ester carboxylesterase
VLRYTFAPLAGRLLAPRMVRQMFAPMPVPPAFEAAVPIPMMLRPWQIRASTEDAASMVPAAAAAAPRYAELRRLPVAILVGDGDRVVDPGRHSLRLHGDLPGSELRILPGLGHMVHHGAPGVVADAIASVAGAAAPRQALAGMPLPA